MTARDAGEPIARPDLAVERALLGGLMVEPEALAQMALEISADDFHRPEHGALFTLLSEMHTEGESIDVVTVAARVQRQPSLYGGQGYVAELPEYCPSTANLGHYAERIAERAQRRRLLEATELARAELADERSELSEIVERLASATARASNGRGKRSPKRLGLEAIVTRRVEWCWRERIPFGGITIIEGDPGLGKTTFALDVLARASRGELDAGASPAVVSLVLSAEDAHDFTIAPRLRAARADPSRVFVLVDEQGNSDVHTLPNDLGQLEQHIEATGARIVLIDPLVAYLGVDTHKDGDVRRALTPLNELAKRHGVAIVGIRHLTKGGDKPALYRGGGSIGIAGAARAVHVVGRDPDDEERLVLAPVKSNLGRRPQALAWRLLPPLDPGGVCAVEHLGLSERTADELVATGGPVVREEGAKLTEAEEWLRGVLEGGALPSSEVKRRAGADGVAWMTVRRAKERLGVKALKGASGWSWSLGEG